MSENTNQATGLLGLPEDLRDWLDERTLLELVYDAMQLMDDTMPLESNEKPLSVGPARALATVLAYSYARALYGSDDIAHALNHDRQLRYLAAGQALCPDQLRALRRGHRARLERVLTALLRLCCERRVWATGPELTDHPQRLPIELELICAREAESRVKQAVLADCMALDN